MDKKYGLQLRVPPSQQKKQALRPPLPKPAGFADDDVEKEISRHASKNKSLRDIEQQHKNALGEDPSVFDYDVVYDEMKEKDVRPRAQERQERKPRCIQALMEKVKQLEQELELEVDPSVFDYDGVYDEMKEKDVRPRAQDRQERKPRCIQALLKEKVKQLEQELEVEVDPSVFDYDGVYDEMKEKDVRPRAQDRQERKPRYIQALEEMAKQRERELDVDYERKLAKERTKDDHLFA